MELEGLGRKLSSLLEAGRREEAGRLACRALEQDPLLPGRLLPLLGPGRAGLLFLLGRSLLFLEEKGRPTRDLVTALLVRACLDPSLAEALSKLLAQGPFLTPCHGDLVVHLFRAPPGDPRHRAGKALMEALLDGEVGRRDPLLAFLFLQDRDPLVRAMGAARLGRLRGGYYAPLAPLVALREKDPQVLRALALGVALSPLPMGRKSRILLQLSQAAPGVCPFPAWHLLQDK
ncbi:MAG TPA: hypothetical protein ENJ97_04665 [Planctomycetes bacterium]|nr:hypothetical protein [Planctomycetota bacterium]